MASRTAAVVPAFEAARTVGTVVRSLVEAWPSSDRWPVIVVDDGSTDSTSSQAANAGALVVRHDRNRGKGAALRTGFEKALELGATYAVTVDADGQHPADEAVRIARCEAPPDALVLGVRDLVRDGAPRRNQFSNGFSNWFLSWAGGRRLSDTQCGLRRYPVRRTFELGPRDNGYAFEAETVLRAARAGWPIVQVPIRVVYPPEAERVSHFDAVRDPARIVRRVLATLATTRASPRGIR